MKKIYIAISILFALSFTKVNAQIYTQGDVSVNLQPSGSHDSLTCSSQGQMFYLVTKTNSFIGDSIKVKDQFGGYIVYEVQNMTGQNPWIEMIPVFNAFGFTNDDQVSGGFAYFAGPINKVISGIDTVLNINNFYQIPVTNPCQYGNISGKVYVDYNNDCVFNGSDVPLSSITTTASQILNSPSMTSSYSYGYSNATGDYSINALESWMTSTTVEIPSYYQFIFPATTCSPVTYNFTTLPQISKDFSLQCTSLMDVQCYAGSQGAVRPSIPFMLFPYVSNTGCNLASGTLKLVLDPNVVYAAGLSYNTPNSVSGDTLIWNYTNLTSLSNGAYWNSMMSGIHLTPNPSVNIGDTLCFRIYTNLPAGDVDLTNNDYTFCLPVVNSYDPNIKEVSPKGVGAAGNIPVATDELTYTIHFQNTGSAPAINISVIDTLDSDILPSSLRILGNSHNLTPQWLAPGVVKFNFWNIYLPDSTSNEPASHGFVRFSVNLNASLPVGTVIQNKASIYFDSNPAIVTNTTINTLANISGINDLADAEEMISIFPNPATNNFNVNFPSNTKQIQILNSMGQNLQSKNVDKETSANFELQAAGIYFIQIITDKQIVTKKLVVTE